ncbi:hypothetical protein HDV05_008023 [Chytridiales sp. JEL 0842]|nr:hypothetical protein HDV05_008023 [Chytridiales sp. JEL 0842]
MNSQDEMDSDEARDPAYFSYYAQFVHQQNMLQDTVRTSLYHTAIVANGPNMFRNKLVMDIGAGSGILSYFAVQAGASKVYAIEASGMAMTQEDLTLTTSAKLEDVKFLPKVDTLISEPIGVLLVHERMIETYLVARDKYLQPGGSMIPSTGTIFLAPFSDATLWTQTMAKVRFWEQRNFYGVDFSPLARDAKEEIFAQPVVGNFDYRILLAPSCSHHVDFQTISMEGLKDFVIPISWTMNFTGLIHGIAGWFDIDLGGFTLSTAPNADRTHWQQVRFVLKEPLAVNAFETVNGWMRLKVNAMRSYDCIAELVVADRAPLSQPTDPWVTTTLGEDVDDDADRAILSQRRRGKWALQEQTYWYTNDTMGTEFNKPEFLQLYTPDSADDSLLSHLVPPITMGEPTNI